MNARTKVLKELVRTSLYVVDERAVAQAIVVRATARDLVPGLTQPPPQQPMPVRSFRRTRSARSFRLCGMDGRLVR